MKNLPGFQFFHKQRADTLDIVLQGGKYGIETPFMQKIVCTLADSKNSVLAFNFPYYERGDTHSSGEELIEELETLSQMMEFAHASEFRHIRFVGKSLGAIVASFYLDKLSVSEMDKYSLVVLGFVVGELRLDNFTGAITVIQGEKDDNGGIEKVKEDLSASKSKDIKYFETKGADHSFKDPQTGEPRFQDEAIKILASL